MESPTTRNPTKQSARKSKSSTWARRTKRPLSRFVPWGTPGPSLSEPLRARGPGLYRASGPRPLGLGEVETRGLVSAPQGRVPSTAPAFPATVIGLAGIS